MTCYKYGAVLWCVQYCFKDEFISRSKVQYVKLKCVTMKYGVGARRYGVLRIKTIK